MTAAELAGRTAAGFRLAMMLFALLSLFATVERDPRELDPALVEQERLLRRSAWVLIAIASLSYSPAHTAWLLGSPTPRLFALSSDLVASALACAAFVRLLGARRVANGLAPAIARRGELLHGICALIIVGVVWLSR